jgi:Calcium-activated chloride channel.
VIVDAICDYFGVKITMYFAWLGHYTTALIVPAVVGFIFWVSDRLSQCMP